MLMGTVGTRKLLLDIVIVVSCVMIHRSPRKRHQTADPCCVVYHIHVRRGLVTMPVSLRLIPPGGLFQVLFL